MSSGAAQPGTRPTNVRWLVFALGFGTSWLLYLHRYVLGLLKPALSKAYGWQEEELGLLDSVFSLFYAVFQVPLGILVDLLGVHFFLAGMILLWSVALALNAAPLGLGGMAAVRGAFGLAQAGAYAALNRVTRLWFPLSIRTSVQGWVGVFAGRIGGASSNLIFATFLLGTLHLSWQASLQLFAAAGVVLAVLFVLLFRDTPKRHPWANAAEVELVEGPQLTGASGGRQPPAFRALLRRTSRRSVLNLLALNLQSFLSTVADSIYVNWIPWFLSAVHGLQYKEMGIYSTLPLLGGACGGVAGGYLSDWLLRRTGDRRRTRQAVGLAGKGLAGAVLLLAVVLFYRQPYHFCALLFLVKFFSDWSPAASWGTVTDIGGRATATVFAFNNSVASIGMILAPPLFALLAATSGWHTVFVVVAAVYVLCAASWLLIDCTVPVLAEERIV